MRKGLIDSLKRANEGKTIPRKMGKELKALGLAAWKRGREVLTPAGKEFLDDEGGDT